MKRAHRKNNKTIGQTDINRLIAMWRSIFLTYPESLSEWLDRLELGFPEFNIKHNKTSLINYINARVPEKNDTIKK
tara:strand:+ start:261 stop:488 length:228 start_codon:yes stop_codon:yes gene_type:complete